MEDHDYAADVPASMDSYNIVVALRTQANPTDDEKATLARNERHLGLKMAIPAFVAELTAEQKGQIEALKITL